MYDVKIHRVTIPYFLSGDILYGFNEESSSAEFNGAHYNFWDTHPIGLKYYT